MERIFSIIGAPFGYAANEDGCTIAPSFLRQNGLDFKILQRTGEAWGKKIFDLGDVDIIGDIIKLIDSNKLLAVKNYCDLVSKKVYDAYSNGYTPIILGGDHSISIGTISATSRYLREDGKKLGILWVDAHADINDKENGNIHGKSVAVALGNVYQDEFGITEQNPLIEPKNMVYIGVRDMMPNELKLITKNDICLFGMDEIDNLGMSKVVKNAIRKLEEETDGFFLSFDIDACEGSIFPGCGTPELGGLTAREAIQIAYEVGKSNKFLGADIVELSPTKDLKGNTNALALKIIEAIWGFRM